VEVPKPHIDGFHKPNLALISKMAKKDGFSPLVIYDGQERGGKSTTMSHDALFMDEAVYMNIKRVAFNIKQVEEAIDDARKAGPGSVVVIDEAANVLLSKEGRNKFVAQLEKILMMNGKYNIIYLLAIPSVFDLTPYIRIHRADCLVHVVVRDKWNPKTNEFDIIRGRYNVYSHHQLVRLLMKAAYKYDMGGARLTYFAYFDKHPTPAEVYGMAYETKKDEAIKEVYDTMNKPKKEDRHKIQLHNFISFMKQNRKKFSISDEDLADGTGYSVASIKKIQKKKVENKTEAYTKVPDSAD